MQLLLTLQWAELGLNPIEVSGVTPMQEASMR